MPTARALLTHGLPLVLAGLLLSACGTAPERPTDSITRAEQALTRAREANAQQAAPLHVRLAEEKLESAKDAAAAKEDKEEEYLKAQRLAEQAKLEAELAEAKAMLASSQENHRQMQQTIERLRQQTVGGSQTQSDMGR